MTLFVRRWDPSFKRRRGAEGSLAPMEAVAAKHSIDIWVVATPSGRMRGLGRKEAGAVLCPYSLRYPVQPWPEWRKTAGLPRFENVYQAAKVAVWTPNHSQMLNGRAVLKRQETTLFNEDLGRLTSAITGREAQAANAETIRSMLDPTAPSIRSQYPKHIRGHIVGSIDWDDLDAPLLGYGAARAKYGEQFQRALEHSAPTRQLLLELRQALAEGKRILIAETDGPDLCQRSDYLRAGVEEFTEDGLMRVTATSWQVVSGDLSRCFGHCWHVARLLLDLPNIHSAAPQGLSPQTLAESVKRAKDAHAAFRRDIASKTAATKKRKLEQAAAQESDEAREDQAPSDPPRSPREGAPR